MKRRAGGVNYLGGGDDVAGEVRDEDDPVEILRDNADLFFVAEPGLELTVAASRFVRLGAEVSYRRVRGIGLRDASDSDLSGPSATFSVYLYLENL